MSIAKRHALVTGSTSGIGLAIARALANEGADVVINGMGDAAAIETERGEIEADFGVKAIYNGADMSKPAEIAAMIADAQREARLARHSRQQRRHPVRLADRGFPDREMGRDPRDQPLLRLPHHPRRGARA